MCQQEKVYGSEKTKIKTVYCKTKAKEEKIFPKFKGTVNQVSDENTDSDVDQELRKDSEDYDVFKEYGMFHISTSGLTDDSYTVSVNINGHDTDMQIDTGCRYSIVNEDTFKEICGTSLLKSRKKLFTYSGDKIPVKGDLAVTVRLNDKTEDLQLTVSKCKGPNLLGRNWIRTLGIDWTKVSQVHTHLMKSQILLI